MAAEQQPKVKSEKEFSLKHIESRYLQTTQQAFQQVMTSYLITIATERLSYQVTPNTQFEFDVQSNSLKIREMEYPEPPKQDTVEKAK